MILGIELSLILKTVIVTFIGYAMYKFKKIENQANEAITEEKVRTLVADKLKPLEVHIEGLKEGTKRIEDKIDRLANRLGKE